jgi:hypothetical protein
MGSAQEAHSTAQGESERVPMCVRRTSADNGPRRPEAGNIAGVRAMAVLSAVRVRVRIGRGSEAMGAGEGTVACWLNCRVAYSEATRVSQNTSNPARRGQNSSRICGAEGARLISWRPERCDAGLVSGHVLWYQATLHMQSVRSERRWFTPTTLTSAAHATVLRSSHYS